MLVNEFLLASIKYWTEIYKGTEVCRGAFGCALCQEYLGLDCRGCPIAIAVGRTGCRGTPYVKYNSYMADLERELAIGIGFEDELELLDEKMSKEQKKMQKKLALKELLFLVSLL